MTNARDRVIAVLGVVGIAGVVVALGAAAGPGDLLSGGNGGHMPSRGPGRLPPTTAPPPAGGRSEVATHPPTHVWSIVVLVIAALAILLVVLLLAMLVRWRLRLGRRARPEVLPEGEIDLGDADRVVTQLAGAAAEHRLLLTTGEPRNAVVACWLAFETAAEGAGVPRRAWETSTEFTVRLLDLVHADHEAVLRLAELFGEARFSTHPMGEDARVAALAALDAIHASLPTAVTA